MERFKYKVIIVLFYSKMNKKPAIVSYTKAVETVNKLSINKRVKDEIINSLDELFLKSTTSSVSGGRNLEYLESIKEGIDECYILEIDIDNFKDVNDKMGHDYGNKVLKLLYDYLDDNVRKRSKKRKGDVIHKHGEEYRVILFSNSLRGAEIVANRLREGFTKYTRRRGEFRKQHTFSGGLSYYKKGEKTLEQACEEADKALLKAKETGKNKVVVYEPK